MYYSCNAIDAIRVYGAGQYRLRGNGHHQPDGRNDHGHRGQEVAHPEHTRAGWNPGQKFGQPFDRGETRMETVAAVTLGSRTNIRVDFPTGAANETRACGRGGRIVLFAMRR